MYSLCSLTIFRLNFVVLERVYLAKDPQHRGYIGLENVDAMVDCSAAGTLEEDFYDYK